MFSRAFPKRMRSMVVRLGEVRIKVSALVVFGESDRGDSMEAIANSECPG